MKDEVDELHERVKRAELALLRQQKQQASGPTEFSGEGETELQQLKLLHQNAALELAAMSDASARSRGMPYVCIWCDSPTLYPRTHLLYSAVDGLEWMQGLQGLVSSKQLPHVEACAAGSCNSFGLAFSAMRSHP